MPDPPSNDATEQNKDPPSVQERQPKKPLNSYQIFLDDNRASLLRQVPAGGNPIAFTGKKAGIMWQALSAEERAPFEQRAAKLQAEYEASVKAFEAKGGTMKIRKRFAVRRVVEDAGGKRRRVPRDKNRPVKPCAGGYGVFLKENRASIKASLPAGLTETDLLRAAAAQFKGLPEDAKEEYNQKYSSLLKDYREKMKVYEKKVRQAASTMRLPVKRADGSCATLALLLGESATSGCHWRLTSRTRHAGARCATPLLALKDWLAKHGNKLSLASAEELEVWRPQEGDGFAADLLVKQKPNKMAHNTLAKKAKRRVQEELRRQRKQQASLNASTQNPSTQNPKAQKARQDLKPVSETVAADALPGFEAWSYRICVLYHLWCERHSGINALHKASAFKPVEPQKTGVQSASSQHTNSRKSARGAKPEKSSAKRHPLPSIRVTGPDVSQLGRAERQTMLKRAAELRRRAKIQLQKKLKQQELQLLQQQQQQQQQQHNQQLLQKITPDLGARVAGANGSAG